MHRKRGRGYFRDKFRIAGDMDFSVPRYARRLQFLNEPIRVPLALDGNRERQAVQLRPRLRRRRGR